ELAGNGRDAVNFLEELVAEWYEFRGYFVRQNVLVGKRSAGGYECELDVVAFHPESKRLVHVEASMDALSWSKRETRYQKKFDAGKRYIPELFQGLDVPEKIEQIALIGYGSKKNRTRIAGAEIWLFEDYLRDILGELRDRKLASHAVPEDKPLLRMLQYVVEHKGTVFEVLSLDPEAADASTRT
ncbi:MAG: hypothetical protein ACF8LL_03275, partial [Phycisphaerales bacterium]